LSGIYAAFRRSKDVNAGSFLAVAARDLAGYFAEALSERPSSEVFFGIGGSIQELPLATESKSVIDGPVGDRVMIVADARIDNRPDLLDRLGLGAGIYSNSNLIILAYRKWGALCSSQLLGDFSYVLWDERRAVLHCSRDHIGVKQLYYYLTDELVVLANDIRPLLAITATNWEVSDEALVDYLSDGELLHDELTFYSGIKKVPPASTLSVTANGASKTCYWDPADSRVFWGKSQEHCQSELRELLEDAVKSRLPESAPVGAHLSGGLDSSAIAAIAASFLNAKNQPLQTYSWMAPPQGNTQRNNPEWARSAQVAKHLGVGHQYTNLSMENVFRILTTHDISLNDTVDLCYENIVMDMAIRDGVGVILSGWGGDHFITHSGRTAAASAFWSGHIPSALRAIFENPEHTASKRFQGAGVVYAELVAPLLSQIRARFRRTEPWHFPAYAAPHISQLASRRLSNADPVTGLSIRRRQLAELESGFLRNRLESWASSSFGTGIQYRYPMLDKRIVEFSLGVSPLMYRRGGTSRWLFRQAVAERLPPAIVWESSKQEPERVSALVEMEAAALRKFYELCQSGLEPGSAGGRCPIDLGALLDGIDALPEEKSLHCTAGFSSVDRCIKSVFALAAGVSGGVVPQPPDI
jgi:asparagine synthase (glutamine-hydrolysing)